MSDVFKVKSTSWHCRMNRNVFSRYYFSTMASNFCWYWRMTLWGLLHTFFGVAWVVMVSMFLTGFVTGFLTKFVMWFISNPGGATVDILQIAIGAAVVAGILWTIRKLGIVAKEAVDAKAQSDDPGIVITKYRSFKDKYCPAVEIDES